ncbi:MAG: pyridoxamine 5'-phosphate oxidase family protein [Coriobacteriia bacterium]|nr:pyridoxamine 5'-phosphate oxidase family protein [Coriobacteriia bacterium]MCL2745646.1 pyridoxamine 5'-phosphate oxidase family protein [Coriobacteriia bacterium]MCL2870507.1 pyridoxamine 5'-phosphate oxidase family protein [Coriobacteriia bacterium]
MSFSENLKTARLKKGISQEQLASMLQVSRQAVSKWEQQDGGYPEAEKLMQIALKLEVSIDSLLLDKWFLNEASDSCKKSPAGEKSMSTKLFKKANKMIRVFGTASIGVIDEDGYPSVSAIALCNPNSISELYFTTIMDSNKRKRLQKNSKASINCFTEENNITLVGQAKIYSDQESKSKYWQDWVDLGADIYPGGVSDPDYCFVRFTTERASLWIDEEGAEFDLSLIAS